MISQEQLEQLRRRLTWEPGDVEVAPEQDPEIVQEAEDAGP